MRDCLMNTLTLTDYATRRREIKFAEKFATSYIDDRLPAAPRGPVKCIIYHSQP